jgi:hypothetical protein
MQSVTQSVTGNTASYTKNSVASQQVTASTDVSGLMGVSADSWTAKDGTVYVILRMNRKDGGALYSSIIKENDSVINDYINDAKNNNVMYGAATFEAYAALNSAANLALITDNYLNILSILNPARGALNIGYGNASTVKKLAEENMRAIVIAINITGDDSGRLKKSFAQVFTKFGFKTSDAAAKNSYTLVCDFTMTEAAFNGNPNKFARYELQTSLLDFHGNEIFTYSTNNREGHQNYSEAVQRALRAVEKTITDAEADDSFASAFNAYLLGLEN